MITGISILDLGPPRNQKSGLFSMRNSLNEKICSVRARGFWFKDRCFPSSACCS